MKTISTMKGTAGAVALVAAMFAPLAASAEQVTLKSADGTVNLVGEYVDFKDDNFIIRTPLGDLRIAASRVRCEGDACPAIESAASGIAISGSDTIGLGMMPLLMTGFASSLDADAEISNPADNQSMARLIADGGFGDDIGAFMVSSTSTDAAFQDLLNGNSQIGMAERRILPDEARALKAEGAGNMVSPDQERIIAVDSVVVITHPSNPVKELTLDQLRGIFSGQVTNWKDVGGEDHPITVVSRDGDSASHRFFIERLFEGEAPNFRPEAIATDDQQASNVVYLDRNAIGYVGYAFQRGAQPITIVNDCGIASRPDAFSAKTEEYALSRRMYLYNRSDNLAQSTRDFLDFAVSEEADGVIAKSGFIDLGIVRRDQASDGERAMQLASASSEVYDSGYEAGIINEMLSSMTAADRLSTTFRFRTGSSRMDEKARADMNRLIGYLERQPAGTKVTLVGFTDSVGAFDSNRALSVARAEQVRQDLIVAAAGRLDHIQFDATGYGEIAPSACNVSDTGRAINRRVEVWISNA